MGKYHQGFFIPKNPKKYIGDASNIIYRSSWEFKFLMECDNNPDILEWSSEEIAIPYRSPLDKQIHHYFPDNFIKTKQINGSIKKQIVEIKPHAQTLEPVKGKKKTKKYIREVTTYLVNQAKWEAAKSWCADRGYDFVILTEKQLFPKQPK